MQHPIEEEASGDPLAHRPALEIGKRHDHRVHVPRLDLAGERLEGQHASTLLQVASTRPAAPGHSGVTYAAVIPPSTTSAEPVTKDASSDARNSAATAISSGTTEPADRDVHEPALPSGRVGQQPRQQRRLDGSWADRVGPDAPAGVLDRHLAGDGQHAALGGRIRRAARWPRPSAHERRHVHDGASTRIEHGGNSGAAPEPDTLEVDLHDLGARSPVGCRGARRRRRERSPRC